MVWIWLSRALRYVHLLFSWAAFRAEDAMPDPIPVDETCPACGHNNGKIRCMQRNNTPYIEHRCAICGAGWFVKTVMEVKDEGVIHPAE